MPRSGRYGLFQRCRFENYRIFARGRYRREKLSEHGIQLHAVSTVSSMVSILEDDGRITAADMKKVHTFISELMEELRRRKEEKTWLEIDDAMGNTADDVKTNEDNDNNNIRITTKPIPIYRPDRTLSALKPWKVYRDYRRSARL